MQRLKRRLWTMAIIALAGVVIGAALISGLFQTAVYLLPSYRDDLSVWVTRVAGRPVQIGGISLVWSGMAPRLDLADITLFSEDGQARALSARRLSLGISLWRLLTADLRPSRVELSGLDLALAADEHGRLRLLGFDGSDPPAPEELEKWLRQLADFRGLLLERCELSVTLPSADILRFGLRRLEAARTLSGFEADGELRLPPAYGETLTLALEVRGDLERPDSWKGELTGAAGGLRPQPWLRGQVAPGTAAGVDAMNLDFEGRIEQGQLAAATLALQAEGLVIARAGDETTVDALDVRVELERRSEGWRAELTQLRFDDEDQIKGRLHYAVLADGFEVGADAELLQLDRLAPFLRYWRDLPPTAMQLAGLQGRISALTARLRRGGAAPRYSVQARLEGLGVPAATSRYALSGLVGKLRADEDGGSFELQPGPLRLSLPLLMTPDVPLTTASGEMTWGRVAAEQGGGWRLTVPRFAWGIGGARGNGHFALHMPADGQLSPDLDLSAQLAVADAATLKPWMPRHWGEGLRAWLQRGIVRARVPAARLRIDGPLQRFPFDDPGTGEWALDLDVADAQLDFAPGWPPLEQMQARLAFRGNGLSIEVPTAQLAGNPVDSVSARLADFQDRRLVIDAHTRGETAGFYQLLRHSPAAPRLAGLLSDTSAAGPAKIALHLEIPMVRDGEAQVQGEVALDGVQMYYRGLDEPIRDIRGNLRFGGGGVTAERLSARFADVAFDAQIEAREGTQGVVGAEFPYRPNAEGRGLSAWIPELVRRHLDGEALFRLELPLGASADGLAITSDLQGLAVRLPPPLAKTVAESAALRVGIGGGAAAGAPDAPVPITVAYADRLAARLALKRDAARRTTLGGTTLRVGPGAMPAEAGEGVRLLGELPELDLDAWRKTLAGGGAGLPPLEADLTAARWTYRGQVLRDTRVRLATLAQGWDAQLSGTGAEGTLRFRRDSASGLLSARLAHFVLEMPHWLAQEPPVRATVPALEPEAWPALDLVVAQLTLNGGAFGELQLDGRSLPGRGHQLRELRLAGGILDGRASGEWLRTEGRSSARLGFEATSGDFTAVLRSFGYAQNLDAERAQLSGELGWQPEAAGIDWAQARGRIALAFQKGTLRAVEPGAGRVLGLLNFYALPRRLTLDFRDVLREGLAYDSIEGSFDLGDGSALTDDLQIEAPSLRMELQGRVGLAARDYDQRVTVYPDVTAGATIGAALLGGPAVAAIAFIAQQVLDKPLDQLTQFSYQVTGSWDNPQVKRIEAGGDSPPNN